MNIRDILIPVLILSVLGGFFAFIVALVAKKFSRPRDEKMQKIAAILPNLNCGGCGFPSCEKYAEGLAYHSFLPLTFCKPGGDEIAEKLAHFLGRKVEKQERLVAKLLCRGGKERTRDKFLYSGPQQCRAAHVVTQGFKKCEQGCLGLGDCFIACTFHAIEMGESRLPIIDRSTCVACGACVKVCPRHLLQLIPESKRVFVECNNTDKGIITAKACDVGCIACHLCEQECPVDAIHVIHNVALIDYAKCVNCGVCVKTCPRGIILKLLPVINEKKEKEETIRQN
jgi:Na+-translocating ferredoxin:NAD+ oxidoreductase subunit B